MDTATLDAAIDQILVAVPEAQGVTFGRRCLNIGSTRHYYWAVEVTMPRRDKRLRVIHGVEAVHASGDTVEAAIEKTLVGIHFHKTGTLPGTEG